MEKSKFCTFTAGLAASALVRSRLARAAASRAMGTRYGEQET